MIKESFQEIKKFEKLVSKLNLMDLSRNSNLYGISFGDEYFLPNISKLKKDNKNVNLQFAINDFRNLIEELETQSKLARISKNSKFYIGNLNFNKNHFDDPYKNYENYLFLILSAAANQLKNSFSFNQFFKKIVSLNQFFLTFSGFIKSSFVSIFSSGLVFSLKNIEEPTLKIAEEFFRDPYFKTYMAICNRHNFHIDKYMPWLIVRKVNDEILKSNIHLYDNVYEQEMTALYSALKNAYIRFVNTFQLKKDLDKFDLSNFNIELSEFIKFFIKAKLNESKIDLEEKKVEDLVRFFSINAKHNSLKNSVKKLDRIASTKSDIILQNWSQIYL